MKKASKSKDMILTVERNCANPRCGKPFKALRYWQRYCSKPCRLLAYFEREYAADQIMKGEAVDNYPKAPDLDELAEMERLAQEDNDVKARLRAAQLHSEIEQKEKLEAAKVDADAVRKEGQDFLDKLYAPKD